VLDAEGDRLCRRCARDTGARTQRIHTRQLFVVFLFCVFLYQVYAFWRKDTLLRTSGEAIPVAVLQFAPRGARYHPLVRGLSGLDPQAWQGPTYADIAAFFDRERERYTGHASANIDLSVRGPWQEVPVNPALADGEVSALRTGLAALRYSWFWRRVAVDHGVDLRRFPMRLFVIFTDGQGDEAANSRAALSGRLAVTYVSLTDPNPAYPAITIAHELAHLLGAADKYGPDTQSLFPEGFVEPHRDPIYPQRYAELMAVDIPIGRGLEREPASFDQVRFGFRSAAELGWVSNPCATRQSRLTRRGGRLTRSRRGRRGSPRTADEPWWTPGCSVAGLTAAAVLSRRLHPTRPCGRRSVTPATRIAEPRPTRHHPEAPCRAPAPSSSPSSWRPCSSRASATPTNRPSRPAPRISPRPRCSSRSYRSTRRRA
jgi:hypothetical protein